MANRFNMISLETAKRQRIREVVVIYVADHRRLRKRPTLLNHKPRIGKPLGEF